MVRWEERPGRLPVPVGQIGARQHLLRVLSLVNSSLWTLSPARRDLMELLNVCRRVRELVQPLGSWESAHLGVWRYQNEPERGIAKLEVATFIRRDGRAV